MKSLFLASIFLIVALSGNAYAACPPGNSLNQPQINSLLVGKMVCATVGSDKWQEEINTDGTLYDWKLGPNHAVDPRTQVGNWSIVGTGVNTKIRFSYTGDTSYDYSVDQINATTFDFCGSTNVLNAKTKSLGSACP